MMEHSRLRNAIGKDGPKFSLIIFYHVFFLLSANNLDNVSISVYVCLLQRFKIKVTGKYADFMWRSKMCSHNVT